MAGVRGESHTDDARQGSAPKPSSARVALSVNRVPAPDLAPWIARLVSAKIENPEESSVSCGMCNDLVFVRLIIDGHWTAASADGKGEYADEPLLFGPQSRFMPLSCSGNVMTAGFGLRPGAFLALTGRRADSILDRIERADPFGLLDPEFTQVLHASRSPQDWNDALEELLRRYIESRQPDLPDPVASAFELAAFADPALSPARFAESQDISLRKLQRIIKRDFGLTPKGVLRRARALDLASQLCGVADDEEADAMILRYFDQSHLIREFAAFFGVTPQRFREKPRPLLTITLEQRQARRLAELERLGPDGELPWRTA